MKSILASETGQGVIPVVPSSFEEVAARFVEMMRDATDANEIRALAANKVANPVLQVG
jgi:hypothetical protein